MLFAIKVPLTPPVVVQLFDWSFEEVSQVLPELKEVGYSHIHISPVQKSVENGKWWGKYQPLDYRKIEGPLGNREELMQLAKRAKEYEIVLIADVVFNHMAGAPHVRVGRGRLLDTNFADFSKEDFHPYAPIKDWSNEKQVRNRWLFGALPDLKTESPTVRAKLTAYLLDLQACGVGGFRVDSARHIPPEDLKAIFDGIESSALVLGEIAEQSLEVFEPYLAELPEMAFFDFALQAQLATSLRGEESMSAWLKKGAIAKRLAPEVSVRMLRNHDLDRGEDSLNEGIRDRRSIVPDNSWQVGYVALFGLGEGVPYVFVDCPYAEKEKGKEHDFDRKGLKESLLFFRATYGLERKVFLEASGAVGWSLGHAAFVILSREACLEPEGFSVPQLKSGIYREVYSGEEVEVVEGVFSLPRFDALRGYAFQLMSR